MFQWQASESRPYAFGEWLNGNARIAIYTGTELSALTLVVQGTGRVLFFGSAGVRYRIAVDTPGADAVYRRTYPLGGADELADAALLPQALPQRFRGNNVLATVAASDEDFTGMLFPPKNTVWWRWTAPATGAVRVDPRESNIGTVLDVNEQAPGASLQHLTQVS